MTYREFLTAVSTNSITDEVIQYATEGIAKHEAELERDRVKRAEKASSPENLALMENILKSLEGATKDASTIASELGVTTSKVSSLCRKLREEGKVTGTKGEKSRSPLMYSLTK